MGERQRKRREKRERPREEAKVVLKSRISSLVIVLYMPICTLAR
jgi:hypothetical protein